MDKKNENGVNLEGKEAGVIGSAAEEKDSENGDRKTDSTESVSKCESTEIVVSSSEGEVTRVISSASKDKLPNVVEPTSMSERIKVLKCKITEVVEPVSKSEQTKTVVSPSVADAGFVCKEPKITEFIRKDRQFKFGKSKSISKEDEVDPTSSGDEPGSHSPKLPDEMNIPSKIIKSSDEVPEPHVTSQGNAEKLPVCTQLIEGLEGSTYIQGQESVNAKAEEQEPPIISQDIAEKLPETQLKEEMDGSSDSQKTECMDVDLLDPPVIFQDTAEGVPVGHGTETLKGSSDSQKKECRGDEEADKDESSQETYCSESSFQRTECTTCQNINVVLACDHECHNLSGGTESLGGASQATTVDVADLEAMPCSGGDMFASQSYQEDTETSGKSSESIADYSDFVKGSHDGSRRLIQSSTTLSMDGSQDPSSKLETSITKSTRKRKHEESDLSDPVFKLQRIAEEDEGKDISVKQVSCSKDRSSLGVDALSSSPAASPITDDVTKYKTSLPVVSPTKITLKEKEVEISPKINRQQQSPLASPKASRKLVFETEIEGHKPQFVLDPSNSDQNAGKVGHKTDKYEEEGRQTATDASSVQGGNNSSPEIEILNSKKSRQSIEVVFVSSHSHDSARSNSQHKIHAGSKRISGNVEVIDIEYNADKKKNVDTEEECSDEELFLHLSPSPSQKSMDLVSKSDKSSSSHSASVSVNHTSYSSYKSSNADSLNSGSRSEQEVLNTTKQDKKLSSGSSNSERHSIYTIQEEIEEPEKMSQSHSSGSSTNLEYTNDSGSMTRKKINMPFSLTKKDIVSPESSPCITDSFTTFSRVKDVAQITSVQPSQFVTPVDSESQLRRFKRKRDDGKQDIPLVSIAGSDSESDSHSTPSEVQKKSRTDNGDMTNGHKDILSILPQKPATLLQKGILRIHSTPQMDQVITPVKESSASSIEQDSTQGNETEWEVFLKVKLKYLKQSDKDVYRVQQCEDITEDINHFAARRLSDYSSSGGLADVSSKNTSPCSTTSGPGPFALPPHRTSLVSMISSSSASSGGSSVAQGVMRHKHAMDGGPFVMPHHLGPKISRDRSFRSEEVLSGIQPGIHNSVIEGMEILERIIISSHPESCERDQAGSTRTIKGDSGRKSDDQKPSDGSTSHDNFVVLKTTDKGSTNLVDSDAVPFPANVLKETPRSTVKPLKGSRSRSSVKKRSLSLTFLKGKEKETVDEEKDVSEIVPNVESKRGRQTPVTSSVQDLIMQIPESEIKGSYITGTRNIPGTPEVLSAVLDFGRLRPGALVFARWIDRKYYSGRLKEKSKDRHWVVLFDDGNVKSLVEDFIIAVDILSKGQLVYALAEDEGYLSGVIVNVQKKRTDILYSVELDDGDLITVSRSSLFMTEDQAKILRETLATASPIKSTPHRVADVSLDNVLEGKRSRIGSREIKNKFDSPGVSGEPKTTPKRMVSSPTLTESDTSSAMEDVEGVEQESLSCEVKLQKVKGQGRRTPRKNWASLMGPIPPQGSKIFAGKFFLLTSSDVKQKYTSRNDSEETDTQGTDYDEDPHNIMFSKSYLYEQITAGNGKLCSKFEDVPSNKYDSCYLITDRPCQTAKFILCLAYGIRIVSYTWIIECCMTNICKPITKHLLPAGWSLEKREYVTKSKKRPLSCMKIGIVSDRKKFLKFWELVLKGAGANVFGITPYMAIKELEHLDVVVSNNACPVDIQEQLKELGKHLVSTVWIVQCLINGTKCAFT